MEIIVCALYCEVKANQSSYMNLYSALFVFAFSHNHMRDTRLRSLLRHYVTSRKVTSSIPDEVIRFFNWPNPSSRNYGVGVDSASNRNEYQECAWR
jgi:hypothetical protein